MDPLNPEAPQEEGQEGEPQPQPEAPQTEEVARQYDYDPELFRSQYEEVKRRERDIEKRERDFQQKQRESERQPRYPDPSMDMLDPIQRSIIERLNEVTRTIHEDREERLREREEQRETERLTRELDSSYVAIARSMGLTKDQMDAQAPEVFDTLVSIYPERSMIRSMGPDVAIRNAMRLARNGNGNGAQAPMPRTGPRAAVVIPGNTGASPQGSPMNMDAGPQRSNETAEQYSQRLARVLAEAGIRSFPEGMRVTSG